MSVLLLLFKTPYPLYQARGLWDGCNAACNYRKQSMRDILRKHLVKALLYGKNVNFSAFKRKRGGNVTWKFGLIPSQFTHSLLSFSLSVSSEMCFSLSVSPHNTLGWHIFSALVTTKNKFHLLFPSLQDPC